MKVFVAGATGAIGRPLVAELVRQGHAVTGMTRPKTSTQGLKELGAEVALVDALDAAAVEEAVRKSGAETVIDQLTSLPKSPADMAAVRAIDRRLRIEGGGNLRRAALACGARRYVQQSSGFFLASGEGLAVSSCPVARTKSSRTWSIWSWIVLARVSVRFWQMMASWCWRTTCWSRTEWIASQARPRLGRRMAERNIQAERCIVVSAYGSLPRPRLEIVRKL